MTSNTFDYIDFFSKVGVGSITGIIAAYFTTRITLSRFYNEKWWERKNQAYTELVNNLFKMQLKIF